MPRRRKGGWWERKGGSPGATSLASSGDEAPTPTIGRGFLWYDPVAGAFMVSEDGAAAAPIGGGGGGTPGSSVVAETSFGQATAVGASAAFAREDHSHGTPANPLPAHVAAADPHPAYLLVDGSRALTGNLAAGGNRLTGVAAPIAATDAATKDYVDELVQGLDWQESVLAQQSAPPGAPTTSPSGTAPRGSSSHRRKGPRSGTRRPTRCSCSTARRVSRSARRPTTGRSLASPTTITRSTCWRAAPARSPARSAWAASS